MMVSFCSIFSTKPCVINSIRKILKLNSNWSFAGPGCPFDTSKYMVVCANVLGSCYGSTGPQSIDPTTEKKYGNTFPQVPILQSFAEIITYDCLWYFLCRHYVGAWPFITISPSHNFSLFQVTIRDSVRLQILMAKDGIGAKKVASVIGGSMGMKGSWILLIAVPLLFILLYSSVRHISFIGLSTQILNESLRT